MTKTYIGWREPDGIACAAMEVSGKRRTLRLRLDLWNHSPTGFEWGYGGSGPAQLALAILADALGNDERAVALHQRFKFKVIGSLPRSEPWSMTFESVIAKANEIEADRRLSNAG